MQARFRPKEPQRLPCDRGGIVKCVCVGGEAKRERGQLLTITVCTWMDMQMETHPFLARPPDQPLHCTSLPCPALSPGVQPPRPTHLLGRAAEAVVDLVEVRPVLLQLLRQGVELRVLHLDALVHVDGDLCCGRPAAGGGWLVAWLVSQVTGAPA